MYHRILLYFYCGVGGGKGGTGLGLYSLRKRMDALGGECSVRDRSDGQQGSVFYFILPYAPDHAAAVQRSPRRGDSASQVVKKDVPTIPPSRILLVDDTPSIIKARVDLTPLSCLSPFLFFALTLPYSPSLTSLHSYGSNDSLVLFCSFYPAASFSVHS